MIENKCSQCGSLMIFDAPSRSVVCKSCGNQENVQLDTGVKAHQIDFNRLTGSSSSYKTELETKSVKCANCGAMQTKGVRTIAEKCQYCGASLFVESDGGFVPDGCLLFEFDKETAIKKFKDGIKSKKFLPSAFKRNPPLDNIEALYFPAFAFSATAYCNYVGRLKITRDTNDYYYRGISGDRVFNYNDVLLEGSRYLTQNEFLDIGPYNLGKLYTFNKKFVIGHSVEYYNRTIEEAGKLAKETMQSRNRRNIEDLYDTRIGESVDMLDIDCSFSNGKYSYLLLPTYKVTYKYGKKEYSTFVNGQTGKVGGRVPRSGKKIFGLIAGVIIAAGALIYALLKSPAMDYLTNFFK